MPVEESSHQLSLEAEGEGRDLRMEKKKISSFTEEKTNVL